MLRTRVMYYQFKNGSVAPISLDVLMRLALTGPDTLYDAWDRSLGAYVWYDA